MRIVIGNDHAGYELKNFLKAELESRGIHVVDAGAYDTKSSDYPDFAGKVAREVMSGNSDQGILICTTGAGMSMAANRYPGIRAAVCLDARDAAITRTHNDANVMVLGAKYVSEAKAKEILSAWLAASFAGEPRHSRRIGKLAKSALHYSEIACLRSEDADVHDAIIREIGRQSATVDLIASENYVSRAVREAQGCLMTNKYAEGYPGKRYYNGCENVDMAEALAVERVKKLFGAEHANVQPHCGSSANMAVYFAVLKPGDTILAMSLAHGGHLTHGHDVNFSGKFFKFVQYGVRPDTEMLDYDEIEKLAITNRPALIVAGASAYPRFIDFKRLREIADRAGSMLMVDMAHIAGLICGGVHPDPVPYADFVTSTTHKTLRGPRSGIILCRQKYAADIDKQVFPGLQGGPLMHTIAAKAVCFREAMSPEFKDYAAQVVKNAKIMSESLKAAGLRIVSGGTDNHLMLVDLSAEGITGKDAALALDRAGIIVNKNSIPFDRKSPFVTSGIRIGTPALTTRGMKEKEVEQIAAIIVNVIRNISDNSLIASTKEKVAAIAEQFPIP